jgi:hypothetical protein
MELLEGWTTQRSRLKDNTNVSRIRETFVESKLREKNKKQMELLEGWATQRSCLRDYTNVSWIRETFI